VIPFNPALPNIAKSQPIRAFRVGEYLTLLLEKPKSLADAGGINGGLISYLYALAVITTSKPADLVMVVTSELSGPELRRMTKETTGVDQTSDPFLCVFDEKGGHHNLGHSPSWANQEQFVTRALELVRERFKVTDGPVEVTPGGAPVSSGSSASSDDTQSSPAWNSRQYLLLGVGAVIAAMLVFPPFRVVGLQGIVLRTGYAFIFDLPHRASVDVGQLFVQWVGVLIVGAIAFFLISKRS